MTATVHALAPCLIIKSNYIAGMDLIDYCLVFFFSPCFDTGKGNKKLVLGSQWLVVVACSYVHTFCFELMVMNFGDG